MGVIREGGFMMGGRGGRDIMEGGKPEECVCVCVCVCVRNGMRWDNGT